MAQHPDCLAQKMEKQWTIGEHAEEFLEVAADSEAELGLVACCSVSDCEVEIPVARNETGESSEFYLLYSRAMLIQAQSACFLRRSNG